MTLPAGDELDRLVAEKVMGRIWRTNSHGADGWACRNGGARASHVSKDSDWDGGWVDADTEEFSTKIRAAWRVVDRIDQAFALFRMSGTDGLDFAWCCQVGPRKTYAATAPHAICLAALAALDT